ncbi:hypothetical protein [Microvirga sp. P5_D2]
MSDQDLIIQRLKDKLGYVATEAEATEVNDLLIIVDAAPRLGTVLGHEPATTFVPLEAKATEGDCGE